MRGLVVFLALVCCCVSAQEPMDVSVSIVTYQEAASAELVKQPSSVLIVSEGLKPEQQYAAKVRVVNQDNDYIEVFPEKNPFPPMVVEPYKPGEYLIPGKAGDSFNVSIRSKEGRPVWLVVTIGEGPAGPEPPVGDFTALRKVSLSEAEKTRDRQTAVELAAAWRKVVSEVPVDKPIAEAVAAAKNAREQVLLLRKGNLNWNAYLTAVDGELSKLKLESTPAYLKAVAVLAETLEETAKKLGDQQKMTGYK